MSHHRLVKQFNAVASDCGLPVEPGATVLDFGCGGGELVAAYRAAGFDCHGTDIVLDRETDCLWRMEPGKTSFPDGFFDLVVSFQVFEHVIDYTATLSEISRVTKPSGAGIHVFPPKWRPLEAHTFVPLAGVVQMYPWLYLWAKVGIRNQYQRGMPSKNVADFNFGWLREHTNYLGRPKIRKLFEQHFGMVRFAEREWIKNSSTISRFLGLAIDIFPFLCYWYSAQIGRVVVTRK